jgi:hypothetical protein
MIVRPTLDGTGVRIRLENTVSTTPVAFSAAYIGVQDRKARVTPGAHRALTFNGRPRPHYELPCGRRTRS